MQQQQRPPSLFLPMMMILAVWMLYLQLRGPKAPPEEGTDAAAQTEQPDAPPPGDTGAGGESPMVEEGAEAADDPFGPDEAPPAAATPAAPPAAPPAEQPATPAAPPAAAPAETPAAAPGETPAGTAPPAAAPDGATTSAPAAAPADIYAFTTEWQRALEEANRPSDQHDPAAFVLRTKDLALVFTAKGAGLQRGYLLGDYFETAADRQRYGDDPAQAPLEARLDLLRPYFHHTDTYLPSLAVRFDPLNKDEERTRQLREVCRFERQYWEVEGPAPATIEDTEGERRIARDFQRVTFRYRLFEWLTLVKRVDVPAEGYELRVRVFWENRHPTKRLPAQTLELIGAAGFHNEDLARPGYKAVCFTNGSRQDLPVEGLGDDSGGVQKFSAEGTPWGGVASNYFAAIMRPEEGAKWQALRLRRETADVEPTPLQGAAEEARKAPNAVTSYTVELGVGAAGESGMTTNGASYRLFVGPKSDAALAAYDLNALKEYLWEWAGVTVWFTDVFKPILIWLADFAGNWGLAIILLTVIVRLAILPISLWQQKSMMKYQENMKRIKPKLDELQKKFKGDRMRLAQEQREFMQRENVSMVPWGCLTIFLQMPIFIGLIAMFYSAIEFRHSSFFLWIDDLANPDVLLGPWGGESLNFFPLSFLATSEGLAISVLPLIYVALMLTQQKLQPQPADEQQARMQKMMGCMFVAFGLIFYKFPAGPLIYFNASMAWSLLEQVTIRKRLRVQFEAQAAAALRTKSGAFKA